MTDLYTYSCAGFRNVQAIEPREAAGVFADRLARRQFGKRGYMHTMRLDHWTQDGTMYCFQAFIGRPTDGCGGVVGHDVWLHVTLVEG